MVGITELEAKERFERKIENVKLGTLILNISSGEVWEIVDFLIHRLSGEFKTQVTLKRVSDDFIQHIMINRLFFEKDNEGNNLVVYSGNEN